MNRKVKIKRRALPEQLIHWCGIFCVANSVEPASLFGFIEDAGLAADRIESLQSQLAKAETENAELRKMLAWFRTGSRALPIKRDELGRMVREAWLRWAETQTNSKPSWLVPYEDLDDQDKEADQQIGETIARWTLLFSAAEKLPEFDEDKGKEGLRYIVSGEVEAVKKIADDIEYSIEEHNKGPDND